MSALALVPEPGAQRMSGIEVAAVFGDAIAVELQLSQQQGNPQWQRRSLRTAARAIMQLWGDLDAEERLAAHKDRALARA